MSVRLFGSLCVLCYVFALCYFVVPVLCACVVGFTCRSVWGVGRRVGWGRGLGEQEGGGLHVEALRVQVGVPVNRWFCVCIGFSGFGDQVDNKRLTRTCDWTFLSYR